MKAPFSGGCACGHVRYTCMAPPLTMVNCYCRDCQRASGGACSPSVVVPRAAVTITGTPKWHEVRADSGDTARRAFCVDCGSPLFANNSASEARALVIKAASLDDPRDFAPVADIWTDSAQPWSVMSPGLPKTAKEPTPEERARIAAQRQT
jgi:hypothetical protein